MTCPGCRSVNTVFTFQAAKDDRCGRCSNYIRPTTVRCQACQTTWCPPCWKVTTTPAAPKRPAAGIADESFEI